MCPDNIARQIADDVVLSCLQLAVRVGKGRVRLADRVASLTLWGKLAESASKLEKGSHVQVERELRFREYKKDRGSGSSVRCDHLKLV